MEGYGPALVLPVALAVIFCCTFARVWGPQPRPDRPADVAEAGQVGGERHGEERRPGEPGVFGSIILLHTWLAWPPLLTMALAANLTCFCDIGGSTPEQAAETREGEERPQPRPDRPADVAEAGQVGGELLTMALAANLTCFCDIGGSIRPRLRALLAFAGLGW
jgi:hypothetical protein